MRKGDFVSWETELEQARQQSEFSVCKSAQKSLSEVTHVRNFDQSGLRVECEESEIRVHGIAQSMQVLGFALKSAEELQIRKNYGVHVDVRVTEPRDCHLRGA